MGRLEFTQILMISYIAASCVQNSLSLEGSRNVILVKQNDDVWCVAQGEAATSALAWTSTSGRLQRGVPYFIGNKSALDCNLMKPESCTGWEGLAVTSSLEHDVPPLFDYRWNNLPLIQTNGQYEFHDHHVVSLPKDRPYWNVTVSVTAEHDAYIVLCEGWDPFSSACYWIILGGWYGYGERCVIRRCPEGVNRDGFPKGTCEEPVATKYKTQARNKALQKSPLYRRLSGLQGPSGRIWRKENLLPTLRFDPRIIQPVASRHTE